MRTGEVKIKYTLDGKEEELNVKLQSIDTFKKGDLFSLNMNDQGRLISGRFVSSCFDFNAIVQPKKEYMEDLFEKLQDDGEGQDIELLAKLTQNLSSFLRSPKQFALNQKQLEKKDS